MYRKPKIIGSDFAGVVVNAPDGSKFKKGDRVYGMLPLLGTKYGAYAQKCCIDESILSIAPPDIPLVHLSSFPLVACTVIPPLKAVVKAFEGNVAGKKCFIQAGSGGVGSFAIQYCAKHLGMYVSTTCSPRNFELVKSLGNHLLFLFFCVIYSRL